MPFGQAVVRRPGRHVTVVTAMRVVGHCLAAAEALSQEGIEAEVIDLRSLVPLDMDTLMRSLRKTHHLVTVEESRLRGGWGAELAARVVESMWDELDGPPERVGAPMVPVPAAWNLEKQYLPNEQHVMAAVRRVLGR